MDLLNKVFWEHEALATFVSMHKHTDICSCFHGCIWCHEGAISKPATYVISKGVIRHVFSSYDKRVLRDIKHYLSTRDTR